MFTRPVYLPLSLAGFAMLWSLWASPGLAATPVSSDLTDFMQQLGGYLFAIPDADVANEIFWEQVSYVIKPAAPSSSNITTIVMTKYKKNAVYIVSGSGSSSQVGFPQNATNPATLTFCTAADYVVETVTLDLRNLKPVAAKQSDMTDGGNKIWSVVLKMNDGSFMRQNTQILPANCAPQTGYKPGTNITQLDVDTYSFKFPLEGEASQFVTLVSNVIPTLNPPILIGATPSQ